MIRFKNHNLVKMSHPFETYYYCVNCGIEVFKNSKNTWVIGEWWRGSHKVFQVYLKDLRCDDVIIKEIIE